jgi:hypothetical protein
MIVEIRNVRRHTVTRPNVPTRKEGAIEHVLNLARRALASKSFSCFSTKKGVVLVQR